MNKLTFIVQSINRCATRVK